MPARVWSVSQKTEPGFQNSILETKAEAAGVTKIEFTSRVPPVQGITPIGGCHFIFYSHRRLLFTSFIPAGGYSQWRLWPSHLLFPRGGYHSHSHPLIYSSTRSFPRRTMTISPLDPNGGCYCSHSPFPNGDHSRRRLCSPLRLVP